jgi:putative acetyltransferase
VTQLRVRPEGPADIAAVRVVLTEAFAEPPGTPAPDAPDAPDAPAPDAPAPDVPVPSTGPPVEVGLVEALRDGPAWLPELSMVAEVDGVVVAYALLTRVTVGDAGAPALALGPVAVRPAYQGLGYGTATVQAALDAAAELGERLVLVLGDPAYYGRFGFEPAGAYGVTSVWSGPHYQVLVIAGADDGDPVPGGEVRYPPPWHDL